MQHKERHMSPRFHTVIKQIKINIRLYFQSTFTTCLLISALAMQTANAASMHQNDPKRPTAKIAAELNINQAQFVACFNHVNPTPGGLNPESSRRVHANKKVLLNCLRTANPAITNLWLDSVMDKYRPGGREAQVPRN